MTKRHVLSLTLAAATAMFAGLSAAPAEITRTVYISAADQRGPVTDLTAEDLTVKEGGKDAKVASLTPATADMDVQLIVDDSGSGAFQGAVLQILQAFINHAKFTIFEMKPQAVKLVDQSNDTKVIQDALNKLGPRGKMDHDGENLNEAIGTAARTLRAMKSARPVIIVLTIGGVGQVRNANFVMDQLRDSGAMLNVLYVSNADIGVVIGDGPRQSGGRLEQAPGVNAMQSGAQKLIDAIANQYVLTYTLPDGVKPSDRLSITTRRKGLSLFAPQRIAVDKDK